MILRASPSKLHFYRRAYFLPCPFLSASSCHYFSLDLSSALLPLRSLFCFSKNQQCTSSLRAFSMSATLAGKETFLADDAITWTSLGISNQLSRALSNAGLQRPSLIQADCIPKILAGNDVVVAAESGSGKTHGYLVPLIHCLCSSPSQHANVDAEAVKPPHRFSIVLCPNVTLCEQVVRMANCLRGVNGKPILRTEAVCGSQGWPIVIPDIMVSTPAVLLTNMYRLADKKHNCIKFTRDVNLVVFDESDLLINGSFQKDIIRLIDMFRFDEKELSAVRKGITRKIKLPRYDYERSKQYIFIAATLPTNGRKTAGGFLFRKFPRATWVSGNFLHHHNIRAEQKWVEVTVDTQLDALIEAVEYGFKSTVFGIKRTMVFANSIFAVESVAKNLKNAGIECTCFHSRQRDEEHANILTTFQEKGGVLVCTDCTRGVDIPNVSHVIQAQFARNVIDYLHRVGRTGRAGKHGLVTNLYHESSKYLVAAVRKAENMNLPVEKVFSRKRSFRNKIREKVKKEKMRSEGLLEGRVKKEIGGGSQGLKLVTGGLGEKMGGFEGSSSEEETETDTCHGSGETETSYGSEEETETSYGSEED